MSEGKKMCVIIVYGDCCKRAEIYVRPTLTVHLAVLWLCQSIKPHSLCAFDRNVHALAVRCSSPRTLVAPMRLSITTNGVISEQNDYLGQAHMQNEECAHYFVLLFFRNTEKSAAN